MSRERSRILLPPRLDPGRLESGCDEVGRGCIAGPVAAAAVIMPADVVIPGLDDSKRLSPTVRLEMRDAVMEYALAYAVAFVSPEEIDRINILQASFVAMSRAVESLGMIPEHLLIDGNRFSTSLSIPYTCIVGGDAKVGSIAAASVLAKTARDEYMQRIAEEYPQYDWASNVGYPTPAHLAALREYGLTPYHRRSFAPCQPTLFDLV